MVYKFLMANLHDIKTTDYWCHALPGLAAFLVDLSVRNLDLIPAFLSLTYFLLFYGLISYMLSRLSTIPRLATSFFLFALMAVIWHFQIQYFKVYRTFIAPEEIGVVLNNLDYWQDSNTLDLDSFLTGTLVVFALFFLVFQIPRLIQLGIRTNFRNQPPSLRLSAAGSVFFLIPAIWGFFNFSHLLWLPAEANLIASYINHLNNQQKLDIANWQSPARNRARVKSSPRPEFNVLLILNE